MLRYITTMAACVQSVVVVVRGKASEDVGEGGGSEVR